MSSITTRGMFLRGSSPLASRQMRFHVLSPGRNKTATYIGLLKNCLLMSQALQVSGQEPG